MASDERCSAVCFGPTVRTGHLNDGTKRRHGTHGGFIGTWENCAEDMVQMELNLPALPPTDTFLDLLEAEDILKQASFDVLCLQEVEKTDVDSMLDLMPEVLAGNFDEFKIFI